MLWTRYQTHWAPAFPTPARLPTSGKEREKCGTRLDHLVTRARVYLLPPGSGAGGEALQGPETALTLYWKNGKVATTDGPYAETKEQLGGILVLEARDMNHAVQLISQHPALTYGNTFEIRPAGDMNEIIKASEQRRRPSTAP